MILLCIQPGLISLESVDKSPSCSGGRKDHILHRDLLIKPFTFIPFLSPLLPPPPCLGRIDLFCLSIAPPSLPNLCFSSASGVGVLYLPFFFLINILQGIRLCLPISKELVVVLKGPLILGT